MKIRVVAVAAVASIAVLAAPANANSLAGKDPYRSGCADTKVYTGKKAYLKNELGDPLGVVKLFYSRKCGTNWGELWVAKNGTGSITVSTSKKSASFVYKAGNGGHHWGDMVYAPSGVCAWAKATVSLGTGRVNHGAGTTGRACG
ncbi:DUF2690 domain-containing protein [Nonomuraea sp. NPDC050556]|uniref:DUF2690 domain-containing protein n=1 Tax=Nonomuraea sp. NPDC050556 TaxID=3364369 RepID=UPI00379CD322